MKSAYYDPLELDTFKIVFYKIKTYGGDSLIINRNHIKIKRTPV